MKVLFLDVDGVLNSTEDWIESKLLGHEHNSGTRHLSRAKLALLCMIIKHTGCRVVLSSTWRLHYSIEDFLEMLVAQAGPLSEKYFNDEVFIGSTGNMRGFDRADEVFSYLVARPEVTSFCILDDNDQGFSTHYLLKDKFVQTDKDHCGMSVDDAYNCITILGEQHA